MSTDAVVITDRERAPPLTLVQRKALVRLVQEKSVLRDRSTSVAVLHQKNTAWREITEAYNSMHPNQAEQRSTQQLKRCYHRIRMKLKEEKQTKTKQTGDDPPPTSPRVSKEHDSVAYVRSGEPNPEKDVFDTLLVQKEHPVDERGYPVHGIILTVSRETAVLEGPTDASPPHSAVLEGPIDASSLHLAVLEGSTGTSSHQVASPPTSSKESSKPITAVSSFTTAGSASSCGPPSSYSADDACSSSSAPPIPSSSSSSMPSSFSSASAQSITCSSSSPSIPSSSSSSSGLHRQRRQLEAEYEACRQKQDAYHNMRMKHALQEYEWARKEHEWAQEVHEQRLQLFSFQKQVYADWLKSQKDMQQQQLDILEETCHHLKDVTDLLKNKSRGSCGRKRQQQ